MPSSPSSSPSPSRPEEATIDAPRRGLPALLLLLEALLLTSAGVYCVMLAVEGVVSGRFGYGTGGFLLLLAVALAVAARSLHTGGRFGIGFGLTWQMFQALVAASLLRGALYWQGAIALILAIVLFVLLTRLSKAEHERAIAAAD